MTYAKSAVLSALAVITFLSGVELAHAFQIQAEAYVTPHYVQATVCNDIYDVPVSCRTTAYGMFPNGVWIHTFSDLYLMPGQCDYAYVYANYPLYFINGNATAFCRFTN